MYYVASTQNIAEFHDSLKVMTWNIRFGSARFPFYGDSCGDKVIAKKNDITLQYKLWMNKKNRYQ